MTSVKKTEETKRQLRNNMAANDCLGCRNVADRRKNPFFFFSLNLTMEKNWFQRSLRGSDLKETLTVLAITLPLPETHFLSLVLYFEIFPSPFSNHSTKLPATLSLTVKIAEEYTWWISTCV